MAWSDREWVLNGASVRVSMVGFDGGDLTLERERSLDGAPAEHINSDLTAKADLSKAQILEENRDISFQGIVLRGPFDMPREEAKEMLTMSGNPNGNPNADVLRPRVNGMDLTRRSRESYAVDFGVDMSLEEAALYEAPFKYVREHVYPMRQKAKQAVAREKWWLHWNPRPKMRRALSNLSRFLATPTVSKHRLFVWLNKETLPDHQLIAFARDDDYFFGVLHSRVHELWALRMGTFLGKGNDPRYTPTTCFETFAFPNPTDEQRSEIADAARVLDDRRRSWLNPLGSSEAELKKRTLTNLYNERPTWLVMAHERLDSAIYAAYGWTEAPGELAEAEILKRLLALNRVRANPNRELEQTEAES